MCCSWFLTLLCYYRCDVEDPNATLCTGPAHSFIVTCSPPAKAQDQDEDAAAESRPTVADLQIPFVIDVREETFSILDHLLAEVWSDDLTGVSGCPPLQVNTNNNPMVNGKYL